MNSILEEVRPVVDFGVVESGAAKSEIFLRPVSEEAGTLRIVSADSVGEGLQGKHSRRWKEALGVTIEPNARWGTHLEFVKGKTNSTLQKELWVRLQANVHGAVVASVDPVDFSVVRQGSGAEEAVLLEGKSPAAIEVESVQIEGAKLSYVVGPCPQRTGCATLKFKLEDGQPTGQIFGVARVKFRNEKDLLRIGIRGLVLGKDQKVIDLSKRLASEGEGMDHEEQPGRRDDDLGEACSSDSSAGKGPLLKWSVINEEPGLNGC